MNFMIKFFGTEVISISINDASDDDQARDTHSETSFGFTSTPLRTFEDPETRWDTK